MIRIVHRNERILALHHFLHIDSAAVRLRHSLTQLGLKIQLIFPQHHLFPTVGASLCRSCRILVREVLQDDIRAEPFCRQGRTRYIERIQIPHKPLLLFTRIVNHISERGKLSRHPGRHR